MRTAAGQSRQFALRERLDQVYLIGTGRNLVAVNEVTYRTIDERSDLGGDRKFIEIAADALVHMSAFLAW